MITGNLSSIVAGVELVFIVAAIYIVKGIIDDEQFLNKNPYFRKKPVRLLFVVIVASMITALMMPQYLQISYLVFFVSLSSTFFLVATLYRQNQVKVSVIYEGAMMVGAKSYIEIPEKEYVQVADGVFDRRIVSPNNLFESELEFRDIIKSLDFDRYIIIFVQYGDGATFPTHWHPFDEYFIILSGAVKMNPGQIYREKDRPIIPAYKKHEFSETEKGCCIIQIPRNQIIDI